MDGSIGELLAGAKSGLERLYGERLVGVYLFGSYARLEATTASDVDLLVVLDDVGDYAEEIRRTSELISTLALDHEVSVSRVFVSRGDWESASSPFLKNLRQDAVAA